MLRIKQITLLEVVLPLKEPFQISSGTQKDRRIFLITLEDTDGRIGWGECVAGEEPNYSPETIDTAWMIVREWVAPRILDKPFEHPGDIHAALDKDFRGHKMAKAGVEMAAWELAAHNQEKPLARLLGGEREKVAVGISIGIQESPERLVEKVKTCLAQGYRKIKIKIMPGKDVAYVKAVREAVGPDAPLMVDANNAYTLDDADTLKQLDDFGLVMIEQPLTWDDVVRHAELQARMKTPICLDESITGVDKAEDMIRLRSGRIINIKPGRVGGFTASRAIHDLCQRHKIPVWCGGMLESGVGRAHNVALASLSNFTIPGDISPSSRYWEKDIVVPEWTMEDGYITVPWDKPGMGVDVDMDRVDDLTVRSETLPAS